jgi:type I restriction enzyme M protein
LPEDILTKQALETLGRAKKALQDEDTADALIQADQALETFLKSCCLFLGATHETTVATSDGKGEKPFDRWGFIECMVFLDRHHLFTTEEKANFMMFHNWRNPVQHFGIEPSKKQVQTVVEAVADFIKGQVETRKRVAITEPVLRKFLKALRELDPDSKVVQIDSEARTVKYNSEIVLHRKVSDLTDEELVRAYLVTALATKLRYPMNKIELEKSHKIGRKEKRTEARIDVLVRRNGKSFMLFEVKSPDKFGRELEGGIGTQLYPVAYVEDMGQQAIKYLTYYTADTATEGAGIVEKLVTVDFKHYPSFDAWDKDGRPNLGTISKEYGIVRKSLFVKGDEVHDLRTNFDRKELDTIRLALHNILYGGGKYQTDLFFNLLGLFLAKIYDEKNTANGSPYQFQVEYKDDQTESPSEVYQKVDKLYRRALKEYLGYTKEDAEQDKGIVFDAPKVKYAVDLVQSISFTSSTYDVLGDFFEKIVWGEFKQSKGQYLTHPYLVRFIIHALGLGELSVRLVNDEKRLPYLIDASCGSGTFLIEAMSLITQTVMSNYDKFKGASQDVKSFISSNFPLQAENRWALEYIYGVEINKDLGMATKVNMVMHGDGSANIEAKDGLLSFGSYAGERLNRSKSSPNYGKAVNEMFDVVVSNPPFSATIDRDTAKALPENFEWGEKIAERLDKQRETDEVSTETVFIERWYQLLRPNGRLGVVLPQSIFSAPEHRPIRLFLYKYFKFKALVAIPKVAFLPYSNSTTSLLIAQKKTVDEVKLYQHLWDKYSDEYEKIQDSLDRFFKTSDPSNLQLEQFSDASNHAKEAFMNSLKELLQESFDKRDDRLSISDCVTKYKGQVLEIGKDWWVFKQVSADLDYPYVGAEAEQIGFKRTRGLLEPRPNELYRTLGDGEEVIEGNGGNSGKAILDAILKGVTWDK